MNMAKDPVCGMNVDEKTTKLKTEYMGKTYYFCNQSCKTTFDKNPARYAGGGRTQCDGGHS
jgi:YHS domain-containing protein